MLILRQELSSRYASNILRLFMVQERTIPDLVAAGLLTGVDKLPNRILTALSQILANAGEFSIGAQL